MSLKIIGSIDLTDSQIKAKEKILTWLNDKTGYFYVLSGAAGTGKTTLIREILKEYKKSVILTAPTHKASHVLKTTIDCPTATIHKLLGLRPNYDISKATDKEFTQQKEPDIRNYSCVIIDETSMIPYQLEQLIKQESEYYKVKILYVGDKYQLKAVDGYSVFNLTYPQFELTEIVRQDKGNPLLDILDNIREDIKRKKITFVKNLNYEPEKIVNNKGYVCLSLEDLFNFSVNVYNNLNFAKNIDSYRLLSYTNEIISKWNYALRNKLKISDKDKIISKDDFMLGYENILNEFLELTLVNSEEYGIMDIRENVHNSGFKYYETKLVSLVTSDVSVLNIVDHNDKNFIKFIQILRGLLLTAKTSHHAKRKEAWVNYFDFKNKYPLIKDYIVQTDKITKSLDYGYALSVHKSQGSTYNNVGIILADILTPKGKMINDADTAARLAYVAFSRAKNIVYYYV